MTFNTVLTVIEYTIFILFVVYSAYFFYLLLTSKEERNVYRLKVQNELVLQRKNLILKNADNPLQLKIERAGLKHFNVIRFQLFRFLFLLFITIYYVVLPLLENNSTNLGFFMIIIFFLMTEPRLKFSLINLFLNFLINRKKKDRIIELFTLFDILKADLNTLGESQEVNVYNTIKGIQPLFRHIQGTLSKFLSMWKRSPAKAKEIFQNEIGGESAKTLGDILYKLDQVPKKEAIMIIDAESGVFTTQYFQKEIQKNDKSSNILFGFFMFVNMLNVVWLVVYYFGRVNESINGTNIIF